MKYFSKKGESGSVRNMALFRYKEIRLGCDKRFIVSIEKVISENERKPGVGKVIGHNS